MDLFYRLNVLSLKIPALRERGDDILLLLHHFLQGYGLRYELSKEAADVLLEYDWPGNIRELQNVSAYIGYMSENRLITCADLPVSYTHLSVLNVLIQAYTVLFRCKNILNRFIIRVTLNGAYKILYEIFQCKMLRIMCHRNVCWKGSPFCWEGFLILYYGISVSGFAKKDCRSTS